MTVPKLRTVSRNGSRYYVRPGTRERAVSVTSLTGMLPKPYLQYWAAKVVAEKAVEHLDRVVGFVIAGDRQGAIDYLKRSPGRDTKGAAETGDAIHEMTADIARGKAIGKVHPEYAPYIDGFRRIIDRLEPEFLYTETTVWNDRLGFSGTFDHLVSIDAAHLGELERAGERVLLMADTKTTRSGVHAEVALQLKGYALPNNVLLVPDGREWREHPIPTQIEGGLVFHLRPDAYRAVPINLDARLPHPIMKSPDGSELEVSLEDILAALAVIHFWDKELNTAVITSDLVEGQP